MPALKESTNPIAISTRLGELLVSEALLTYEQLHECMDEHKKTGRILSAVIIDKGYLTSEKLVEFVSQKCGFKFVRLSDRGAIKKDVLKMVPEKMVRQKLILPIQFADDQLTVAMCDPLNVMAVDEIRITTGLKVGVVITPESDMVDAIERAYGSQESSAKGAAEEAKRLGAGEDGGLVVQKAKEKSAEDEDDDSATQISQEEQGGIIQIVNLLLVRAVKCKASDIHIEPYQKTLRVRYRMDGVLYEQPSPPKKFLNAIVSRLKIMASLDIAERRRPQDGRIKVKIGEKEVDLRISICPCTSGEKVVIRIMDSAATRLDIGQLGMDPENFAIFNKHIKDPHGIILVTGPTGSGKSTTLYSTLHTLNSPDVNIMTAEDPVELVLQGINQVHCNAEIGLTFASSLRSFLRQDPDIIMVGEIRDQETMNIAINAALTGHLVFSTLHTNDAPGAVTRIMMMDIDPVLVSSALIMVVAQRLVRTICKDCKESYEVETQWLANLGVPAKQRPDTPKVTLYKGKGCENCAGTGYRGRIGIHEVLEITDNIRELISQKATAMNIKDAALKNGMITLEQSAVRKLLTGLTTAEEVIRVTGSHT
ncbi:MAG TPA: ATPase, T2SS/T4P/T4SS family [Elusimicrobiota bacterium]|nr:ATPase, T2SS/T4P/T4SS family [Elusimicrobiota bacterium]